MTTGRRAALLAGLVLAVYANSLDNGFHFDDEHSIVDNPALRSLGLVPSYFVDAGRFSGDPDVAMYRPLSLVTFALNHAAGGLEPFGYHLVNVLLHTGFVILVFAVCTRLCGGAGAAWWAAAITAVHPANSQAVDYVSSRSGILAALGVLGAFWLVSLTARPRPWAGAASLGAGLLSKSTAMAAAPLVAVWQWGRPGARHAAPLAGLAAVSVAYVVAARHSGFLTAVAERLVRPPPVQGMTQAKALVYYLYLVLSPFHLSVAHPFEEAREPAALVMAAALLTLSLLGVAVHAWRRGHVAGFGLLWFYGGLALTSLVPLHVLVSEQRLYLSSAGLAFCGAALLRPAAGEANSRAGRPGPVVVLAALLAVLTWQRNEAWQDELSLWTDAARLAPDSHRVRVNLGEAYYELGDTSRARLEYERAVALAPDSRVAWHNLGVLYENAGRLPEAARTLRRALALRPDWPEAQANLGRVLLNLGRTEEAAGLLAHAVARQPAASTLVNLGVAAARLGDPDRAAAAWSRALTLEPGRQDARIDLAALRLQQAGGTQDEVERRRLLAEAARLYEELLGGGAGDAHPTALVNLAGVRAALDDDDGARRLYERALREHPGHAQAYAGYGRYLSERGEHEQAVAVLGRGTRRLPSSPGIWRELGKAEARRGRFEMAARALREAVRLQPGRPETGYELAEALRAVWRTAPAGERRERARADAVASYRAVEALAPGYRQTRQHLRDLGAGGPR